MFLLASPNFRFFRRIDIYRSHVAALIITRAHPKFVQVPPVKGGVTSSEEGCYLTFYIKTTVRFLDDWAYKYPIDNTVSLRWARVINFEWNNDWCWIIIINIIIFLNIIFTILECMIINLNSLLRDHVFAMKNLRNTSAN